GSATVRPDRRLPLDAAGANRRRRRCSDDPCARRSGARFGADAATREALTSSHGFHSLSPNHMLCLRAFLLIITFPLLVSTQAAPAKAVLVTGASSGLGRTIAEKLAASGYYVYAGARKAED